MKKFSFLFFGLSMVFIACCGLNAFTLSKTSNLGVASSPTAGPGNPDAPNNSDAPGGGETKKVVVTFYGFNDNDDGNNNFGTSVIAYPKKEGHPTNHDGATEGTGTYDDPITFAASLKAIEDDTFPVGSIIYVPYLQKYFMLEDQCATCKHDQVDLYMGRNHDPGNYGPLEDCQEKHTKIEGADIILKPSNNLPVDTTALFEDGQCTARTH